MGETRVDLHHLLEDLRDAYPGALEETILTEIIANALDSGARTVRIHCDPASAILLVIDDGSGMQRRDLARYHDIASSTKTRGQGIGFAGIGIKLGLLVCEDVVTETRRGKTHIATRWHLASRHKAPWKWEPPPGNVTERGTAIRLKLTNPLSPLLDTGFVEGVLLRHFKPLLETEFELVLADRYPNGVAFEVNGRRVVSHDLDPDVALTPSDRDSSTRRAPIAIRLGRKRKPVAVGYLLRTVTPAVEEQSGLGISTLGKVIKRGWDWLGLTPATPERVGGLIEVPALAECLTLNKADFIRTGSRGAMYLAYRKAIQEAVGSLLAEWGDAADRSSDRRRRAARPVERDLERVLIDLADEFPLLSALVERREGGQRRLPIGQRDGNGHALVAMAVSTHHADAAAPSTPGVGSSGDRNDSTGSSSMTSPPATAVSSTEDPDTSDAIPPEAANEHTEGSARPSMALPGSGGPRRPARYGLEIQFDHREDAHELARLVDSTVWVNESHPAYRRAAASRSEGYHVALSVAMALAPLAVEPPYERAFIVSFLERWGEAVSSADLKRRSSPRLG